MLLLLWPYLVSAAAAAVWTLLLHRRVESAPAFFCTAFIGCLVVVEAVDYACGYLVPLDIAGTPPPDPRNARLRLLITAAVQVGAALAVAGLLALPFRARRRSRSQRGRASRG